jgi:hypothetical protein
MADGGPSSRRARWAEKLRRAADLEHWAAFRRSFEELAGLLGAVARGERASGDAPATVCVLSGDVHHAYAAEAHFPDATRARVFQLTCSPLHNSVPPAMKLAFRIAWSRLADRVATRLLRLSGPIPEPSLTWERLSGPYFGNEIATLLIDGRDAEVVLERSAPADDATQLRTVARLTLSR